MMKWMVVIIALMILVVIVRGLYLHITNDDRKLEICAHDYEDALKALSDISKEINNKNKKDTTT